MADLQTQVQQLEKGGFSSEEISSAFGFEPVDTKAIEKIYEEDIGYSRIADYDEIETIQK